MHPRTPNLLLLAATLALCACRVPAPSGRATDGVAAAFAESRAEWERAAKACAARGEHLGASRYLEASLAAGGDEERLLPLLAAAQIRAGRLRAARESVDRLEAMFPGRPGLADLALLLDSLIDPAPAAIGAGRNAGGGR
ncbi:MAG TPA: hypothetical protein VM285_01270 [Polyangia bacterium]|nr:hypothetical protein [Polyangia bacterium]